MQRANSALFRTGFCSKDCVSRRTNEQRPARCDRATLPPSTRRRVHGKYATLIFVRLELCEERVYCCQAPGKTVSITHRSFICIRNEPIVVVRLRYPARCSRSLPTASSRPYVTEGRCDSANARAERTNEHLEYFIFPSVCVGSL